MQRAHAKHGRNILRSTQGEWAKDLDKLPETTEFKHKQKILRRHEY